MIERIPTADGGCVAVKRRPVAGGTPVVFLHGLAVNADLWDLPEAQGADFHYRSLAALLHDAGYDVSLMNLRGHGGPHMLSAPPWGQRDWCLDHFILFDLPAVVERVLNDTGQRPFVIGASMGAMTIAGYLVGARLVSGPAGPQIIADPDLSEQRQQELAGCVLAEFPAVLRWPESLYDERGGVRWRGLLRHGLRNDGDINYPFELLSRWGWLHAAVNLLGEVPLGWLGGRRPHDPWYGILPQPLARLSAHAERATVQAVLRAAGTFTGATSHRAEVMLRGRRYVLNGMKAGVLGQLCKCVRRGAFVSALGTPDLTYSEHYRRVRLPVLVVQGGRDRIANAHFTRTAFFDRIASADKTFLYDAEIAHGEIEAAPVACERLYPRILKWLEARRPTGEGVEAAAEVGAGVGV